MGSAKKYSKNDLARLYESCPAFKKYCQFNLCSEEFGEYDKVKYFEKYLQEYTHAFIQRQLLQCFSSSFLAILHTSPSFMKFVKSGFIKYIDFHFLLYFQSNSFHYSNASFKAIELFVEEYFQRYSRKVFEEDLLKCLVKSVNEVVPKSLQGFMDSRLRFFYNQNLSSQIIDIPLYNGVKVENNILAFKKSCCSRDLEDKHFIKYFYLPNCVTLSIRLLCLAEVFSTSYLKFGNKSYKSLVVCKDPLSVAVPYFFNTFLLDTPYDWGLSFGVANKKKQVNKCLFFECFIDKSSFVFNYFFKLLNSRYNEEILYMLSMGYDWCFYRFLDVTYKPLNMPLPLGQNIKVFKKDIHLLLEFFVEGFDDFVNGDNDIDITAHKNIIFKGNLGSRVLLDYSSNFETLLKIFDDSFSKDSNKSHINCLNSMSSIVTEKTLVTIDNIENLLIYSDKSFQYSPLDFDISIENLFVVSQKSLEEVPLFLTDNLQGISLYPEEIVIDTFEDIKTLFIEATSDTFINTAQVLDKFDEYSLAGKKQTVFLSPYRLEYTVNEWGFYCVKNIDIYNKFVFHSSDYLSCVNSDSRVYRYFYHNIKKVSVWESSYLTDCRFTWGICDYGLRIISDE